MFGCEEYRVSQRLVSPAAAMDIRKITELFFALHVPSVGSEIP